MAGYVVPIAASLRRKVYTPIPPDCPSFLTSKLPTAAWLKKLLKTARKAKQSPYKVAVLFFLQRVT